MLKVWQQYLQLAQIGWEANTVVALRLMRLASGGALAQREAQRMIAEKALAAVEAQTVAAAKMLTGQGTRMAAKSAAGVYRRKVRANRRRLARR